MTGISTRTKWLVGLAWLLALAAGLAWGWSRDLSTPQILAAVHQVVSTHPLAPLVFVAIYTLRAFTFFPAMFLTIAAGSLFGFWVGLLATLFGENLSAHTAYGIARFFGTSDPDSDEAKQRLAPLRHALQMHAFPTVLTLRASYLPFDLVNFGCGLLRVPWPGFALGTLIGLLPPMLTFVSFGASVEFEAFTANLDDFRPANLFNETQLLVSAGLVAASALIVWFARAHRRHLTRR